MAAVGPGGGGPGPRTFAPLRMLKELEDSMEPASLILAELLVVLCAWLTGGVIFFYFSEKYDDNKFGEVTGSTLWYTIYFCGMCQYYFCFSVMYFLIGFKENITFVRIV